jgi:hypothetical protein
MHLDAHDNPVWAECNGLARSDDAMLPKSISSLPSARTPSPDPARLSGQRACPAARAAADRNPTAVNPRSVAGREPGRTRLAIGPGRTAVKPAISRPSIGRGPSKSAELRSSWRRAQKIDRIDSGMS